MAYDPRALPRAVLDFLAEPRLATLTTIAPAGGLHVVAIAFTFDADVGLVRIITSGRSRKAAHARARGRAAVGQVDGPRWLSLEGPVVVRDDPEAVAAAVAAYTARYRPPRDNPERVTLEIAVELVLGRV